MGIRDSGWRNQITKSGRCWEDEESQMLLRCGWTASPGSGGSHLSPLPQSQGALTAIIVVFSLLAALLLVVGLFLLVRKLREKRQTEGTYRPSSEEQFSHAAEARAPQDSKETVRGCLPI
ncbi:hypothetical protein HPG69_008207 [Diceros bicornis minor]|uniref:Uncharacterized protein n=1 Tax=Diceros bicornis minor TaxID=77932 RepID=A0A7J7E787_DICBM|nr:hypothetical protein HPG69_008207 [Diceros bicornis minor]